MRKLKAKYNVVCLEVFVLRIKVGKVMHTIALPCAARIEPFIAEKKERVRLKHCTKYTMTRRCLPVRISVQVNAFGSRDLRRAIGFGRHDGSQKEGRQKKCEKDHHKVGELARGHVFDDGTAGNRHLADSERCEPDL